LYVGSILIAISIGLLGVKQWVRLYISLQYLSIFDLLIKLFASLGIIILTYQIWIYYKHWKLFETISIAGRYSYELYLVHGYALLLFEFIADRVTAAAAVIIISIIGTAIFHFVVDKLNGRLRQLLIRN